MNPGKLQQLKLAPAERQKASSPAFHLYTGAAVITLTVLFFAWPRESDKTRLMASHSQKKEGASEKIRASDQKSESSTSAAATTPSSAHTASTETGVVLTASGYIITRERIELSPRYSAVVKWVGVRKGDLVEKDQVLVTLEDADQKAQVMQAEGRWKAACAASELAEIQYRRAKKLRDDKVETQEFEDTTRLRRDQAQGEALAAEGALAFARAQLDYTVIRSPIQAVVLEKLADAGEMVTPQSFGGTRGPSTALVALGDLSDLQVEVDLNESDLPKVFHGQQCEIVPEAYPDLRYRGSVVEISPEAKRDKGTLQIKVRVENPDTKLTPELMAKVDFLPKK